MSKVAPHVSFHEKRFLYTYSKQHPADSIMSQRKILPLEVGTVKKKMPKSPRRSSSKRTSSIPKAPSGVPSKTK